jgi:iron complex outermembrane receptor protein
MNNKNFSKKLLALSVFAASVGSLPAFAQSGASAIEEVIVTGSFRDSLTNALNVKRTATAAVDSIVADDIASFPDNNLAESMQRVPGVNIDRVGGEGKQISVRGLSADFTRVRVNGMETISTGAGNGGRAFDFNIFASELFSRIDVRKSQSAEIEEGSLGATVDLATGKPLDYDSFTFVTSVQGGYNEQSESVDPRATALISFSNEPGTFGALFSVAYSEREVEQRGHNSGRWEANAASGINRWANAGALPDEINNAFHPRFPRQIDRNIQIERTGLTGAIQWKPSDATLLTLDAMYADIGSVTNELTLTPISLARTGATGRAETTVNDYYYDAERNGLLYADVSGVDVRNENFRQDWSTKFQQFSLTLDHEFDDDFRMKAVIGTSDSKHKVHSEVTASFEAFNQDMSYDYRDNFRRGTVNYGFDVADPSNYWVSELRDRPTATNNTFDTARIDLAHDFQAGAVDFTVKTGLSWKKFEFDNVQYTRDRAIINQNNHVDLAVSVPAGCGITLNDLRVTSDMGSVYQASGGAPAYFLPNLNAVIDRYNLMDDSTCFPLALNAGSQRSVTEESEGVFVQLDFSTEIAGLPFRGDVGFRHVKTDQTSDGLVSGERQEIRRDYNDTLPSANFVLEPVEDVLVRASWSEVMTRPGLGSLTPGGSVDRFNRVLTAGNPSLDPFRAKATDLSVEWYFAEESMVSLAWFKKDIESFPKSDRIPNMSWSEIRQMGFSDSLLGPGPATVNDLFEYRTTVNGGGGTLDGWEVQYQQPFNFGPRWLNDFGIKLNYTWIESEVDGGTNAATQQKLPSVRLNGQSKVSWNGTLWYENEAGFSGRVSMSHRDAYQRNATSTAGSGVDTTDAVRVVDAAFSYRVNDNIKLTFDALNLTNEPETLLQGDYDYIDTIVTSGRQYYAGIQYSF